MSTDGKETDKVSNSPQGVQPEYVPVEVADLPRAERVEPRKPRFATRPGWSIGLAMFTSFFFMLLPPFLSVLYSDYQGGLLLSSVVADSILLVSMFMALTAYCGNGFAAGDSVRFSACVAIVLNLVAMVFVQSAIFISVGKSQAHRQLYPARRIEKPKEPQKPVHEEPRGEFPRDFFVPKIELNQGSRSGSR